MKPVILVVLGVAMLFPIMHHHTNISQPVQVQQKVHASNISVTPQQKKKDTDVLIHHIGFWSESFR